MAKNILVILIAGCAAVAGGFYLRYWSAGGFPADVLRNAVDRSTSASTISFGGSVIIDAGTVAAGSSVQPIVIELSGQFDSTDVGQIKSSLSVSTELHDSLMTSGLLDPGFIKFDIRSIGDITYFRLNAFPRGFFDLTPFVNQWVKIVPQELRAQFGMQLQTVPVFSITSDERTELRRLIIDSELVRHVATLPNKAIGDQKMHHYSVILDRDRLIQFIPVFMNWASRAAGITIGADERNEMNDFISELQKTPAQQYPAAELLIGFDDGLIHQISLGESFDLPGMPSGATKPSISVAVQLSDYGAPIVIEAPAGALPLSEIVNGVTAKQQQSPATVSYNEALEWLKSLPVTTRADFEAAADLVSRRYRLTYISPSNYEIGLACSNYILQTGINKLSSADIKLLRTKTGVMLELGVASASDSNLKKSLYSNWTAIAVMPGIISEVGLNRVSDIDRSAPGTAPAPSRDACATMPVPAKYK